VTPLSPRPDDPTHATLQVIGERLAAHYGPLHWWPAETAFEVVVGAVLAQNTAWTNVELAIANLKATGVLGPAALAALPEPELAELIRPSGTYRVKATRLKALLGWLGLDWQRRLAGDLDVARVGLLAVPGVGPETADAILLYAAGYPTFVIDAYTRRILGRIGVRPAVDTYEGWRGLFMQAVPPDIRGYNEYHAGLVHLAKDHCRVKPACSGCPLRSLCITGGGSGRLPARASL